MVTSLCFCLFLTALTVARCTSLRNVSCGSDSICHINCNHIDCKYKSIISTEYVNELSVNCSSYQSCLGTVIICPDGDCLINCNSDESCSETIVNTSRKTNLFVTCEYGDGACGFMDINAETANNVSIVCKIQHDIGESYAYDTGSVCYHININANYVNTMIYIECIASKNTDSSRYACNSLLLEANYANKVILENIWSYAHTNSVIYANYSSTFNVSCINKYNNPSCSDLTLSGSDTAILICEGYGCGMLNLYSQKGITDWTFNFNGCGLCDILNNKCTGNNWWYIYCVINETFVQHAIFTGSAYFFYYTQFCTAVTSITNNFYNDKDSCSIYDGQTHNNSFNILLLIDADIILPTILFIFIILPLIGLIYFYQRKSENPSIAILRYVLCGNLLIIIAHWNLLYISINSMSEIFISIQSDDQRVFILFIVLSCNILIELIRTIDGCTFQTVYEPFPSFCYGTDGCCAVICYGERCIKPQINEQRIFRLSDSLLTHIYISLTNKTIKNKLIFDYYNMRQYWRFNNWAFIITTFLNVLTWNIAIILQFEHYIKWFQIYPIIVLFFVIILVKKKYRKGKVYQHGLEVPLASAASETIGGHTDSKTQQSQKLMVKLPNGKVVMAEQVKFFVDHPDGEIPVRYRVLHEYLK